MPRLKKVRSEDEELEVLKEKLITEVIEKLNEEESVVSTVVSDNIPIVSTVVPDNIPKRYIANIYWELEPHAKDIFCGSYVYWESTDTVTCANLTPEYDTDLINLSQGSYICEKEGRKYIIGRWETPKEWLVNLPFAVLGRRFICKDIVELYETE